MYFKRIGMYYIMIAKRTKVHSPTSSIKRMLGSSEATVKAIEESATRISDIALRTPLTESKWLSVENKCNVYLKLESEQINGSFKLRGATNKLKLLQQRACDNGKGRCKKYVTIAHTLHSWESSQKLLNKVFWRCFAPSQ